MNQSIRQNKGNGISGKNKGDQGENMQSEADQELQKKRKQKKGSGGTDETGKNDYTRKKTKRNWLKKFKIQKKIRPNFFL